MDKKPILIVPIVHAEQDLPGLLAKAAAGARVFLEKDKRLVAELRALADPQTAAQTREPAASAPSDASEGGLGLRDRARELFLGAVPSESKVRRRRYLAS